MQTLNKIDRALRELPVRPGGRLRQRFAVIVNGEKIGEIRQVKLRRIVGYGLGDLVWFGDYGDKHNTGPVARRDDAAKRVFDAWTRDTGTWEFSLTFALKGEPVQTRTFATREERQNFYGDLGGPDALHKGRITTLKFDERLVEFGGQA